MAKLSQSKSYLEHSVTYNFVYYVLSSGRAYVVIASKYEIKIFKKFRNRLTCPDCPQKK